MMPTVLLNVMYPHLMSVGWHTHTGTYWMLFLLGKGGVLEKNIKISGATAPNVTGLFLHAQCAKQSCKCIVPLCVNTNDPVLTSVSAQKVCGNSLLCCFGTPVFRVQEYIWVPKVWLHERVLFLSFLLLRVKRRMCREPPTQSWRLLFIYDITYFHTAGLRKSENRSSQFLVHSVQWCQDSLLKIVCLLWAGSLIWAPSTVLATEVHASQKAAHLSHCGQL